MSAGEKSSGGRAKEIERRLSQIGKDLSSARTPGPGASPLRSEGEDVEEEDELVDALFRSVGSDSTRLRRIVEAIDRRLALRR